MITVLEHKECVIVSTNCNLTRAFSSLEVTLYEPRHGKNLHLRKQTSVFVFATRILQFLYFLSPKLPASNHLLLLYRPVCVGPDRNPNCWFSHAQAHIIFQSTLPGFSFNQVYRTTSNEVDMQFNDSDLIFNVSIFAIKE